MRCKLRLDVNTVKLGFIYGISRLGSGSTVERLEQDGMTGSQMTAIPPAVCCCANVDTIIGWGRSAEKEAKSSVRSMNCAPSVRSALAAPQTPAPSRTDLREVAVRSPAGHVSLDLFPSARPNL